MVRRYGLFSLAGGGAGGAAPAAPGEAPDLAAAAALALLAWAFRVSATVFTWSGTFGVLIALSNVNMALSTLPALK
jgi:hypothetical protein